MSVHSNLCLLCCVVYVSCRGIFWSHPKNPSAFWLVVIPGVFSVNNWMSAQTNRFCFSTDRNHAVRKSLGLCGVSPALWVWRVSYQFSLFSAFLGGKGNMFSSSMTCCLCVISWHSQRFDFCKDVKEMRPSENLGQVLFGERIESSPYQVGVKKKI